MKILKNKKGQGVPTMDPLQTLIDAIRSIISWFLAVTPKPMLMLIFLFMLVGLGSFFIPLFLNGLGYHCDTNGVVWKIGGTQFLVTFDLLRNKPEFDQGIYMKIPTMVCGGSGKYPNPIMAICTDCPKSNINGTFEYCSGDGQRLNNTWWQFYNQLACEWQQCGPPENYFYNFTEDKYQCDDTSCINESLAAYNQKLYSTIGAFPVYTFEDEDKYNYLKLVYLKCQTNNPTNIRLTFFGIDVFDYKLWLLLLLVGTLLTLYFKLK